MSELKTYNSERIYWAVEQVEREAGDVDRLHLDDNLFYLKSEADKVIAEKDKEIQRLEKLCENYICDCDNLAIMTDKMRKAGRTLREKMTHQKYKRCLAMAEACRHKRWRADVCDEEGYDYARSTKQMNRWLELADKFKPNNSTAQ